MCKHVYICMCMLWCVCTCACVCTCVCLYTFVCTCMCVHAWKQQHYRLQQWKAYFMSINMVQPGSHPNDCHLLHEAAEPWEQAAICSLILSLAQNHIPQLDTNTWIMKNKATIEWVWTVVKMVPEKHSGGWLIFQIQDTVCQDSNFSPEHHQF